MSHTDYIGLLSRLDQILARLDQMAARFDKIDATLQALLKGQQMAQATIEDIIAEVTAEKTVADSAVALLTQLFALRNDPAKLQAAFDQMVANKNELAAAITANTPQAPAPTPAP